MRSFFLISSYLGKDILKSWSETPGAFVARLLIASLLGLLFFLTNAGFILTKETINDRIESLGVNTVVFTARGAESESYPPKLAELLDPLGDNGLYLPLQFSRRGALFAGQGNKRRVPIAVYREEDINALMELVDGLAESESGIFLISSLYPRGMEFSMNVRNHTFTATTFETSPVFRNIKRDKHFLFFPDTYSEQLLSKRSRQVAILLADDIAEVPDIVATVEHMLKDSDFRYFNSKSAVGFLEELQRLETIQANARYAVGAFVAALIILLFGSIAVFEFRQNRFVTALMKSLGIHSLHLLLRYLAENVLILFFSLLSAWTLARTLHPILFDEIGFDSNLLDLSQLDPYTLAQMAPLGFVFMVSAIIGILPVAWGLRNPVGRVLG